MCGCKGKCGCNITSTTKGEKGDASPVASLGYKSYIALLTQTGTDAPVATVLQNTLGVTPTFSYLDIGYYTINSSSAFVSDKTFSIICNGLDEGDLVNPSINSILYVDSSTLNILTTSGSATLGTKVNGCLNKTSIEIRVYS